MDIVIILFTLVMIGNIVALVRHWRMMSVLKLTLTHLIETQNAFHEAIERDRETTP